MSQMEDESKNAAAPFPGFQVSKLKLKKKKKLFFASLTKRQNKLGLRSCDVHGNEKEYVHERDKMVQHLEG
jgi:hypothetical protein